MLALYVSLRGLCVWGGGGGGRWQGRQLVPGRGLGRRKNYEKWGVSKKKVIKQDQMKNLRQKLLCVGILNLGLMKSKEKRSDGNFPYIFFCGGWFQEFKFVSEHKVIGYTHATPLVFLF